MAWLVVALAAGCGGGGGGDGGSVVAGGIPGAPAGAIAPGAVCTVAGIAIPTVTLSDPTSGNLFVTTSTSGVAGGGKSINATFSLAMNPATINATTFTLAPVGGTALTPASVSYNAAARVATFTTSAALLANTSYTGVVTQGATSAAIVGVPLGCAYAFNFKTAAVASTGAAPVNLGLVAPFGIASAAGLVTAGGLSTVNGNVVLEPTATCDAVNVDGLGGIGPCGNFRPTINGTVTSQFFDPTNSRAAIMANLQAVYLSIAPPGGQNGTLAGATSLGCDVIGTGGGAGAGVGCAGNATLPPGVYIALNSSIGVTGMLTLDAGGNPDAVFIFQTKTPSTLTTAAGSSEVRLAGGAKASNVWWQVGSSATIGVSSIFNGNILADTSITMNANSTSCGRMLAGAVTVSGAITLGNTTAGAVVSVPGNAFGPALCQ